MNATNVIPSSIILRSRRGGLLAKLLVGMLVLFVLVAIAWALLLPTVAASVIRSKTGFAVQLDRLAVNPFTAKVHLTGLVLQNPGDWPEKAFVQLREFRADADLFPLFRGQLRADEVRVDVERVTLVKNKDGVLNAVVFKERLAGQPAAKAPEPAEKPAPAPAGAEPPFMIKRLVLKFDRLVYADHSGRRPSVKEYDLGIDRELHDVDSVLDIVSPFRGAALGGVSEAIGGMFEGTAQLLQGAGELLKDTGEALKESGKKTGETLKGLLQQLEKKKP